MQELQNDHSTTEPLIPSRTWKIFYFTYAALLFIVALGLLLYSIFVFGLEDDRVPLFLNSILVMASILPVVIISLREFRRPISFNHWLAFNTLLIIFFARYFIYFVKGNNFSLELSTSLILFAPYPIVFILRPKPNPILWNLLVVATLTIASYQFMEGYPLLLKDNPILLQGYAWLSTLGLCVIGVYLQRKLQVQKFPLMTFLAIVVTHAVLMLSLAYASQPTSKPAQQYPQGTKLTNIQDEIIYYQKAYDEEIIGVNTQGLTTVVLPPLPENGELSGDGRYYAYSRRQEDIETPIETPCSTIPATHLRKYFIIDLTTGQETSIESSLLMSVSSFYEYRWMENQTLEIHVTCVHDKTGELFGEVNYYTPVGEKTSESVGYEKFSTYNRSTSRSGYEVQCSIGILTTNPCYIVSSNQLDKRLELPAEFHRKEFWLKKSDGLIFTDDDRNIYLINMDGHYIHLGKGNLVLF